MLTILSVIANWVSVHLFQFHAAKVFHKFFNRRNQLVDEQIVVHIDRKTQHGRSFWRHVFFDVQSKEQLPRTCFNLKLQHFADVLQCGTIGFSLLHATKSSCEGSEGIRLEAKVIDEVLEVATRVPHMALHLKEVFGESDLVLLCDDAD